MTSNEEIRRSKLAEIIGQARLIAPAAKVFGSCADFESGKLPRDVDILYEGSPDTLEAIRLLALARRHYGWVDVFVRQAGKPLLVRNDEAMGWTVARKAREIAAAADAHGVPLSEFDGGRRLACEGDAAPSPLKP